MNVNEDINFIEYKDNPLALFEKLLKIWRQEISNNNKKTTEIIIELNTKHGWDFCELAIQAMNEGFNCFDIHHILRDAIPLLNHNLKSTVEYLKKIHTSMQGDLVSGNQFSTIENLTHKQPRFARELLNALINSGEPFIIGYIAIIFVNFAKNGIKEAHNELLTLISNHNIPVVQGVILALGNLKYDSKVNNELIKKTFSVFDELLERKSDDLDQFITRSLGILYYLGEESRSRLMMLAKKFNPNVSYEISSFLFMQYKNINDDKWFEEILMTLSTTKCEYKGIIDNLDFILYGLLENINNYNLIERFFTEWLLKSDYNPNKYEIDSLFGSTLSKMTEINTFFDTLITKYLNHDNSKFHRIASDLIKYSNLYKKRPLNLDQAIIQSLSIEDILYICRKILGYIYDVNTICSLIYSVLEAKQKDIIVKELVYDIFCKYIGFDYPGTTLEFLKSKLLISDLSYDLQCSLKDIASVIESHQKMFKSLPRLNELSIPKKYEYQILLEESKKTNKYMEEAQKKSIIRQLVTNIPLKYGRGWFSYRDGKYCEPSKLSSISHSFEIPKSEIINPVSASIQRVGFRIAKRGE